MIDGVTYEAETNAIKYGCLQTKLLILNFWLDYKFHLAYESMKNLPGFMSRPIKCQADICTLHGFL